MPLDKITITICNNDRCDDDDCPGGLQCPAHQPGQRSQYLSLCYRYDSNGVPRYVGKIRYSSNEEQRAKLGAQSPSWQTVASTDSQGQQVQPNDAGTAGDQGTVGWVEAGFTVKNKPPGATLHASESGD